MTAPVEIALERRGGTVIAHVGGEIDMTNAGHVRDELLESIPNGALAVVIELERCRYLDSAGTEVVFDLSRRLGRRRQDLRLVLPAGSPLTRVLELTDVASAAQIHESMNSALAG